MRQVLCGALTCLLTAGAFAQRGGGMRGGGGFGRGGGGFSHFGGMGRGVGGFAHGGFGHGPVGMPGRGGFSGGSRFGGPGRFGFNRGFHRFGFNGFGFNRFGSRFFFGLPFAYSGFYDPFFYDSSAYPAYAPVSYPSYYAPSYENYAQPPVIIISNGGYPAYAPEYEPPRYEAPPQPAPAPQPSARTYEPPLYLIAFNDHTIKAALAYWTEYNALRYVTMDHEIKTAPLSSVDRDLSMRLNGERRVAFRLPPVAQARTE